MWQYIFFWCDANFCNQFEINFDRCKQLFFSMGGADQNSVFFFSFFFFVIIFFSFKWFDSSFTFICVCSLSFPSDHLKTYKSGSFTLNKHPFEKFEQELQNIRVYKLRRSSRNSRATLRKMSQYSKYIFRYRKLSIIIIAYTITHLNI